MFFIGWFFAYVLRHIAAHFVLFAFALVLFLGLYALLDRFLSGKKNAGNFKYMLFFGLLVGFLQAHVLQRHLSWQPPPLQTAINTKVLSLSAKSFVGQVFLEPNTLQPQAQKIFGTSHSSLATVNAIMPFIKENKNKITKIRFLKMQASKQIFSGMQVEVSLASCKKLTWGKQLFYNFEILQGISHHCYLKTQPLNKHELTWVQKKRLGAHTLIEKKLQLLSPHSLAAGFLLAQTSQIPSLALNMFRKMGIAHIFSASGLHVGILTGIIVLPFSLIGFTSLGFALALPAAFFYLVLLDFKVSLMRAFLFLLFFVVLRFWDKKTAPLYILLASTFLMELYSPFSLFTISYVLSAGITLTILYLFPFYQAVLKRFFIEKENQESRTKNGLAITLQHWKTKSRNFLIDHSALTLAAFSGSLFLSYFIFDYVNALSIFYNFIVVPFSGVYLALCLLLFVFPWVKYLIDLGDSFFYGLTQIHHWFFDRYFPSLLLPFMYYYLVIAFLLLLWGLFLYSRGRAWTLKKYGYLFFATLLMAFFLQFPFTLPKEEGFYTFPYGVLHYQKGNVKVYGKAAAFLDEKFSLAKQLKNKAIWNVEAENLQSIANEKDFFGTAASLPATSSTPALIRFAITTYKDDKEMLCVVFQSLGRKKENYWQPQEIAECQNIVWVVSKKFRYKQKRAQKFFARFGFQGKVEKGRYFKWNSISSP